MDTTFEDDVQTAARSVGFSIDGGFITETVREFVREGNWRKGYDFLMDCLAGMEASMALDFLSGKLKLVGVNEVELAEDDQESVVQGWLDYKFRDSFSWQGKVWKPYGYVTSFQREDWHLANKIGRREDEDMLENRWWSRAVVELLEPSALDRPSRLERRREEQNYRSCYYAQDRRSDICIEMAVATAAHFYPVLCKQVDVDLPLWHKLPTDGKPGIRAAYAAGRLQDLCAEVELPEEYDEEDTPVAPRFTNQPAAETEEARAERLERQRLETEAEEKRYRLQEEAFEREVADIRSRIAAAADADTEFGWLELSGFDKKAGRKVTLRVPHRAFICAALSRAHARHLMPVYSPVSRSGMKMLNDCVFHTDAWLGCGQDPDEAYNQELPEQCLFMDKLYELQRERLNFPFDVLAHGKENFVAGEVIHDPDEAAKDKILVLDQARPEFAPAALKCAGVIVQTGSKLAHLVVVSREESIPVVRLPDALHRFPEGRRVSIDFTDGKVELSGF